MIDLRPPNGGGGTPQEQIQELRRYLFQLVQELNWALQTLEKKMEDGKE